MDELDIRILRELITDVPNLSVQPDIRKSYYKLANRLGVSDDTIRERIDGFHKKGLIRGWRAGVNPTIFGCQTSYLFFDVSSPAEKGDVLTKLKLVPHVLWINEYLGNSAGVLIAHKNEEELEKNLDSVSIIMSSKLFTRVNNEFPKVKMSLTETDYRTINSLRDDPRKSFLDIARELELSSRTVKRRLQRMIEERVFFVFPDMDLTKLEGSILTSIAIFYFDSKFKREVEDRIMSRFGDYYVFTPSPEPAYGAYVFLFPNLSLVEELRSFASSLREVKNSSTRPLVGFYNLLNVTFERELGVKLTQPPIASS